MLFCLSFHIGKLQVILGISLQTWVLLQSLLQVAVGSILVALTSADDGVQIRGKTVGVLDIVQSSLGSSIVLVEQLSQSGAVVVRVLEVLLSLSVVALSDVECAESRLRFSASATLPFLRAIRPSVALASAALLLLVIACASSSLALASSPLLNAMTARLFSGR